MTSAYITIHGRTSNNNAHTKNVTGEDYAFGVTRLSVKDWGNGDDAHYSNYAIKFANTLSESQIELLRRDGTFITVSGKCVIKTRQYNGKVYTDIEVQAMGFDLVQAGKKETGNEPVASFPDTAYIADAAPEADYDDIPF